MISDAKEALESRFNKKNLKLQIPQAFEHLKGKDVNFEMITSSSMQQLELQYQHNIAVKTHAVIFVHDHLARLPFKPIEYIESEEKIKMANDMFKDIFGFDEVEICKDLPKADILTKLQEL